MSIKEMAQMIGKTVGIQCESWVIPMVIDDVKRDYGKTRLLVRPVQGEGEAWVDESRVRSLIPVVTVELRNSIGE